ncbi:protein of unknown function DUF1016 [Thiorhodococcus drewsii AZ1]|uniref:YhcG N-terminal domain-containing protein n=1 Tax=Thiorhodococcus drewsii AZ1 TaxID=765913 RepID=G2E6X0_9GAMM|nr:DUF1016 N-terminal domain-containing protein [Thiorhodococcus drewsii]EGV28132.1 protein of unknown function DUF1016 [Thiorhodococcus drewsii AZ1]
MSPTNPVSIQYASLLADIKQRIRHSQTKAWLSVNAELIRLYWEIGALIDARQRQEGWGTGVIPRLARDLHNELPEEKGFSERNIKRMLAFYRAYPTLEFVPLTVAQTEPSAEPSGKVPQPAALFTTGLIQALPWGHHALLMEKVKETDARQWYMRAAVEHGWSRSVLLMQIQSAAHVRQGQATSNALEQGTRRDTHLAGFGDAALGATGQSV